MLVPFLNLRSPYEELKADIDAAVARTLASGRFILGAEVEAFESDFSNYCGAGHCVGLANGLDALTLALRALGVGPGDEVIVPSNTFIATWLAVSAVGALPVPVEPEQGTFNIDVRAVRAAISPATKAIIPVHLYGQPSDIDAIALLAKEQGIFMIEDAAQAHGALYKGKRIGAHSDVVCWSFYPGKNLGAMGDGGAITTDSAALAQRIRSLGNYGSKQKYVHDIRGVNSRLDPLQAAVLKVKLAHLDAWNMRRRKIAAGYTEALKDTSLTLPYVPEWADPVWHLYVVRSDERDGLQAHLTERGIGTLIHYPVPPHMQRSYVDLAIAPDALPIAQTLAGQVLSLPIGPHMTDDQVAYVIAAVTEYAS